MIEIKVVCFHCGTPYSTPIDVEDRLSLCPSENCYGKRKPTCIKCDKEAKYTQPDKETGEIVEVCDQHFIYKYMG